MRPAPFDYYAPASLPEALALLDKFGPESKLLAGGQSLIPLMNLRLARPRALIDLARVPDLGRIALRDGQASIGAMVTHAEVERSRELGGALPMLPAVARFIGHEAIRNRGTVGGSLAHADPLAEWPLVMTLLGARIRMVSGRGERWMEAGDFFLGPLATALAANEAIVSVEITIPSASTGWAFKEIARRPGDFALASVGALVRVNRDGTLAEIRVAVGGCGRPNFLVPVNRQEVVGCRADDGLWEKVAEGVSAVIEPEGDIHATAADRHQMARVLARRALAEAAARARSQAS